MREVIKWLSIGCVQQSTPLCKHVFKIWFPAQSAVCVKTGFERLILFLAPFSFLFPLYPVLLLLEHLCSLLEPRGKQGKYAGSVFSWFYNYLLLRFYAKVKISHEWPLSDHLQVILNFSYPLRQRLNTAIKACFYYINTLNDLNILPSTNRGLFFRLSTEST